MRNLAIVNTMAYPEAVMDNFGSYLHNLRKSRGLTLKQVEKEARVSNAYLSQIERSKRRPPHPDILKRLARVYEVTHRELLIAAGYLEGESEQIKRQQIEKAFQHATTDPKYRHGTRLKGGRLSLDAKRFIVEMYEKMTGRKLIEGA
jgi:transcriptional regulator with XRE-family HTH domain